MAEIHWLDPVSGNFNTASDWSGGRVPGRPDDVFIDAAGKTPYTVSVTTQEFMSTLKVAATATLDLGALLQPSVSARNAGTIIVGAGGNFNPGSSGTGAGLTNTGTISVESGGAMTMFGTVQNSGFIGVVGSGQLRPATAPCVLMGGGEVGLDGGVIIGGQSKRFPTFLTNVDNSISGAGEFERLLAFTNEAAGVVDADATGALVFARSGLTLGNAGLIEATNHGVCKIERAVTNTGTLEADGGTLDLMAAVTGAGAVDLAAGRIVISNAGAAESIAFTGGRGTLELTQSQTYAGSVSGFAQTGKTSLDLRDIGFIDAGEATFSGTASGGVLTVTDGTHTAQINLKGDYLGATFVASSDGAGGTDVVATTGAVSVPPHRLIAAMASLGGSAGEAIHLGQVWTARESALARPHATA